MPENLYLIYGKVYAPGKSKKVVIGAIFIASLPRYML